MSSALLVAATLALVALAAVLAVAEVSLLRTPAVRIQSRLESGDKRAAALAELIDELPLVLNTILMVVLATQVSAAALTGYLAQRWFGGVATTLAVMVLTIVLFVYSEAIPKTLALRAPLPAALALARPLRVLVRSARGVTWLLLKVADAQMPGRGAAVGSAFSEEELRILAEESAMAGEIERDDVELVHRSFEFGDTRVRDVMVPRRSIVAIPASSTPAEALGLAVKAGHRRLPVHDGGLDTTVGVVRLRDLAGAADAKPAIPLAELTRPVLRVQPSAPIADLLEQMQTSGLRMALVVDEQGATQGLATIEDIVAELVGEIEELD